MVGTSTSPMTRPACLSFDVRTSLIAASRRCTLLRSSSSCSSCEPSAVSSKCDVSDGVGERLVSCRVVEGSGRELSCSGRKDYPVLHDASVSVNDITWVLASKIIVSQTLCVGGLYSQNKARAFGCVSGLITC